MNISINDFILEADDFFNAEECNFIIEYFDVLQKSGFAVNRKRSNNASQIDKADHQIFYSDVCLKFKNSDGINAFNQRFWEQVYPQYLEKYGVLETYNAHNIHTLKIQKTCVGGDGYHIWHSETSELHFSSRISFFILYLNDVDEGGETEFLYLSKRIKPKQGKLLLAPAHYTHTHRGNPPLTGDKYILTGWVEFD